MAQLLESGMTVVKDDYYFKSEYIMVNPESYISSILDDFILRFHQSGIFVYLNNKYKPDSLIFKTKDPRKMLTIYMLSAGFYLWLISVLAACLVFVIEHAVRYFSRTRYLNNEE